MAVGVVVLLFTDLVGSTELLDRLGERGVAPLRERYFAILGSAIAAHGGTEVKSLGDGVMAVFPSAGSAVAAASVIQDDAARYNREGGDPAMLVRVGVHAGEAEERDGDYFGLAVHVASRLCDRAVGGQVLCSAVLRGLVPSRSTIFRSVGPLRLKGVAEPVEAYEVLASEEPAATAPDAPPSAPGVNVAPLFVGRQTELRRLEDAVDAAWRGHGSLALLVGEPGIGKTRLATELAARADASGAVTAWGSCWEAGGAPSYWPWIQVLRRLARGAPPELLQRWAPDPGSLSRLVPELGPPPDTLPEADDAAEGRFALFDAVANFLAAAAMTQPVLVVLDDLHAADRSSLLLLHFVARRLRELRVLVLGTSRELEVRLDPDLADLMGLIGRVGVTFPLRGLGAADIERYVTGVGGAAPAQDVVERLQAITEGNPFFLEQLVHVLAAEGRLEIGEANRIPAGVRDAVRRHLGFLEPAHRDVLALASVLGRDFDATVLAAVTSQATDAIDAAVATQVVAPIAGQARRFRFSHTLIRDTLYDDLSPTERASLHGRVGEAIEALADGDLASHLAELAHHFNRAIDVTGAERAHRYSAAAAEGALRRYAYEEATTLFRQALQALEAVPGHEPRDRLDLLIALADAERLSGAATALERTAEAISFARSLGDPQAFARAAVAGSVVGDERLPVLDEALLAIGDDDPATRVQLLARVVMVAQGSDQYPRMLPSAEEAVTLARRQDDPELLASALTALHMAMLGSERLDERLAVSAELMDLVAGQEDFKFGFAVREAQIGDLTAAGDVQGLEAAIAAAEDEARAMRRPMDLCLSLAWRAMRLLLDGRLDDAEPLVHQQLALDVSSMLARGVDPREVVNSPGLFTQLFHLRREQGRIAEMETDACRQRDMFRWTPWSARVALLYAETGRLEQARSELDRLAERRFVDIRVDYRRLWLPLLAELCTAVADEERASLLYELVTPYRGQCFDSTNLHVFCTGAADRYLGLLATTLGRWDEAQSHLDDALRIHRRMRSSPWIAHSQHDLARMLLRRRAPGDAAHATELLAEARSVADALGMLALRRSIDRAVTDRPGPVPSGPRPQNAVTPTAAAPYVFRCEGDMWFVSYEGRSCRVRDTKGMHLLARLLAHPGTELHALDLDADGRARARATPGAVADGGLRLDEGNAGPVLDEKAKSAYKRRLGDLTEELEEAEAFNDTERAAAARLEIDALVAQLSAAVGLGGRDRVAASASERARVNVTRTIRAALTRIGELHPALGEHLRTTVRTGNYCSYAPDPRVPVRWDTSGE